MPPSRLLISCISTKHSLLRQHWKTADARAQRSADTVGSLHKPPANLGGCLCLLDEQGEMLAVQELPMPAGMLCTAEGILVAGRWSVMRVASDLSHVDLDVLSLPFFNALHSIRRTRRGLLLTSTGLDLVIEIDHRGRLLWEWWAMDHGFEQTPLGKPRSLDRSADHRRRDYGTLTQTTHPNSAEELADGRVVVTLFHQHMAIVIDRQTGAWQPFLEDLRHVHAARRVDDDHITLADTGRGRALLVNIDGPQIVAEVQMETSWLQDCVFDAQHERWILVDGEHSRIALCEGAQGDRQRRIFSLDPDWRLYEALPFEPV